MKRRTILAGLAGLGATTFAGRTALRAVGAATQTRQRQIGYLSSNASTTLPTVQPFFDRLRELGYVEGANVAVHLRMSEGEQSKLPAMAADILARQVDLIVATGGPAHYAATAATRTVPIVLVVGPDPVEAGFVTSLSHPGGNVTGISMNPNPVSVKKLEFLKDVDPAVRRIAVLYRSDNTTITSARAAQEDAPRLGLEAEIFGIANLAGVDAQLERIATGRFDGIITTSLLTALGTDWARVPEFVARLRLPACYGDAELVRAGGLMHYAPNFAAMYRDAAVLTAKILEGAKPADLPIAVASQFDLAVNLSAAERIGIRFPSSILRQATEVVP